MAGLPGLRLPGELPGGRGRLLLAGGLHRASRGCRGWLSRGVIFLFKFFILNFELHSCCCCCSVVFSPPGKRVVNTSVWCGSGQPTRSRFSHWLLTLVLQYVLGYNCVTSNPLWCVYCSVMNPFHPNLHPGFFCWIEIRTSDPDQLWLRFIQIRIQ